MAGERVGHTLQATALVNEAYLRLIDARRIDWQNRAHFLAMVARLMRRILVDAARAKRYQKRGGGANRVTLHDGLLVTGQTSPNLEELRRHDPVRPI
jgi:RNA polymerase sigma factor (TIGR02999 family)